MSVLDIICLVLFGIAGICSLGTIYFLIRILIKILFDK